MVAPIEPPCFAKQTQQSDIVEFTNLGCEPMNEDRWFWIVLIAVALAWVVGGYVSASPVLAPWIQSHEKGKFSSIEVTTARGNSTTTPAAG